MRQNANTQTGWFAAAAKKKEMRERTSLAQIWLTTWILVVLGKRALLFSLFFTRRSFVCKCFLCTKQSFQRRIDISLFYSATAVIRSLTHETGCKVENSLFLFFFEKIVFITWFNYSWSCSTRGAVERDFEHPRMTAFSCFSTSLLFTLPIRRENVDGKLLPNATQGWANINLNL